MGSGGSDMTNGTHRITGTAGQALIGISSSSARIAGQGFWYQVHSIATALDEIPMIPATFVLHQNFPNPFNPSTIIAFTLPAPAHVLLVLYRPSGQVLDVLIDETLESGRHRVRFVAEDLPTGVYIYRLISGGSQTERKMLLLK